MTTLRHDPCETLLDAGASEAKARAAASDDLPVGQRAAQRPGSTEERFASEEGGFDHAGNAVPQIAEAGSGDTDRSGGYMMSLLNHG